MKKRTCLLSCLAGFMLLIVQSAHAQIIFVPQSGAPATESCFNAFPMKRVGFAPFPDGTISLNYAVSPFGGTIGFNGNWIIYVLDNGSGDVYDNAFYLDGTLKPQGPTTFSLTMPAGTRAFSFNAADFFNAGDVTIEVTSTDGTYSVGPLLTAGPEGIFGTRPFYGFYTADPSTTIKQINISANGLLGIGRFRIYQGEYISPNQVATTGPLLANSPAVCAGQPVSLNATGTGNSFIITGPDNYVFSTVYRSIGTHPVYATGITQPGQYTLKSSLGCTESVSTITLTTCP